MRKILFLVFILCVSISCKEKVDLDDNFKNVILKYQEKFSLPKKSDSVFPYYLVGFRKIMNDTIIYISRGSVNSKVQYESSPIFEDEKLKPTKISDFDSLSIKLVKEFPKSKEHDILKFPRAEYIKPTHVYIMKGLKIVFLKEENY